MPSSDLRLRRHCCFRAPHGRHDGGRAQPLLEPACRASKLWLLGDALCARTRTGGFAPGSWSDPRAESASSLVHSVCSMPESPTESETMAILAERLTDPTAIQRFSCDWRRETGDGRLQSVQAQQRAMLPFRALRVWLPKT